MDKKKLRQMKKTMKLHLQGICNALLIVNYESVDSGFQLVMDLLMNVKDLHKRVDHINHTSNS